MLEAGGDRSTAYSWLPALLAAGARVLCGGLVPTVVCLALAADELGGATCPDSDSVEVPTEGRTTPTADELGVATFADTDEVEVSTVGWSPPTANKMPVAKLLCVLGRPGRFRCPSQSG